MLTVEQLRAARGLLGWSQAKLAQISGVAISTIKRMEGERGPLRSSVENLVKVREAFEKAGVVFIDRNGGGPGVRLKD